MKQYNGDTRQGWGVMVYEICVEAYWLLNVCMNWILLWNVRELLQIPCNGKRCLAGAALGGMIATGFLYGTVLDLPLWLYDLLVIMIQCGAVAIMACYTFRIRSLQLGVRVMTYLGTGTILAGGCITVLDRVIHIHSAWPVLAIAGAVTWIRTIWNRKEQRRKEECMLQVRLSADRNTERLVGLLDSGNRLIEPISRRTVSVADRNVVERLCSGEMNTRMRIVPYRSVGRNDGYLTAYRMDEMVVIDSGGVEHHIVKPYVAIAEHAVCNQGTYQIILPYDVLSQ